MKSGAACPTSIPPRWGARCTTKNATALAAATATAATKVARRAFLMPAGADWCMMFVVNVMPSLREAENRREAHRPGLHP